MIEEIRLDKGTFEWTRAFVLGMCRELGNSPDLFRMCGLAADILQGETCLTPTAGEMVVEFERGFGQPLSVEDREYVASELRKRMAADRECARLFIEGAREDGVLLAPDDDDSDGS
jgi:hypothetical protein